MSYKEEFPDFGKLDVEIPKGFEDISWHNDVCPSFYNEEYGVRLWVDYKLPQQREMPERYRFALTATDEHGEFTSGIYETDSYEEILKELEAYKQRVIDGDNNNN